MYLRILTASLLLACCTTAQESREARKTLYVHHSGDDSVGKQFAFALREQIRKSSGYRLSDSDSTSAVVEIVTIDVFVGERTGQGAAASIVVRQGKGDCSRELNHEVVVIGANEAESKARLVLSDIDNALN